MNTYTYLRSLKTEVVQRVWYTVAAVTQQLRVSTDRSVSRNIRQAIGSGNSSRTNDDGHRLSSASAGAEDPQLAIRVLTTPLLRGESETKMGTHLIDQNSQDTFKDESLFWTKSRRGFATRAFRPSDHRRPARDDGAPYARERL
ncbi:hypothetical protein EVAR_89824_1 [Eumeta japonica]|uniref:Uncharacterized protein n=1 Tax=Eumeta variegata TaxID=151549 RepID=A0A4C1YJW6_EUMVA|nr:hypothetical protein EVAR_89824_1 [Eumeta japonica]